MAFEPQRSASTTASSGVRVRTCASVRSAQCCPVTRMMTEASGCREEAWRARSSQPCRAVGVTEQEASSRRSPVAVGSSSSWVASVASRPSEIASRAREQATDTAVSKSSSTS